jgi:hypothetical protein
MLEEEQIWSNDVLYSLFSNIIYIIRQIYI